MIWFVGICSLFILIMENHYINSHHHVTLYSIQLICSMDLGYLNTTEPSLMSIPTPRLSPL